MAKVKPSTTADEVEDNFFVLENCTVFGDDIEVVADISIQQAKVRCSNNPNCIGFMIDTSSSASWQQTVYFKSVGAQVAPSQRTPMYTHIGSQTVYMKKITGWTPRQHFDIKPPLSDSVSDSVVLNLASRSVTLGALLEFVIMLHSGCFRGLQFNPHKTTTAEVTFNAIIPATRDAKSDFSDRMRGGKDCFPMKMVTHSWAMVFLDMVAAIVADAEGADMYFHFLPMLRSADRVQQLMKRLGSERLLRTYWICIFCVNEHLSICPSTCSCGVLKHTEGELSEMNKFDQMMRCCKFMQPDFGQVVAVDKQIQVISRCWVVAEIAECQESHIHQTFKPHFPLKFADQKTKRLVRELDVRNCQASHQADKDMILSKIKGCEDPYNERVRTLLLTALNLEDSSAALTGQQLTPLLYVQSCLMAFLALVIIIVVAALGSYFGSSLRIIGLLLGLIVAIGYSFYTRMLRNILIKYGFVLDICQDHNIPFRTRQNICAEVPLPPSTTERWFLHRMLLLNRSDVRPTSLEDKLQDFCFFFFFLKSGESKQKDDYRCIIWLFFAVGCVAAFLLLIGVSLGFAAVVSAQE